MDSSALYVRALTSWQIIAVCLFLMCLLPLVFYIASTKSRKKSFRKAVRRRPVDRKPLKAAAQPAEEGAEAEEGPDARRRERAEPPLDGVGEEK
jgi:hypothetical protein